MALGRALLPRLAKANPEGDPAEYASPLGITMVKPWRRPLTRARKCARQSISP